METGSQEAGDRPRIPTRHTAKSSVTWQGPSVLQRCTVMETSGWSLPFPSSLLYLSIWFSPTYRLNTKSQEDKCRCSHTCHVHTWIKSRIFPRVWLYWLEACSLDPEKVLTSYKNRLKKVRKRQFFFWEIVLYLLKLIDSDSDAAY